MADVAGAVWHLEQAVEAVERGDVRLLTSDVFDTVLWRPTARPHDAFLQLARRLRADGRLQPWVDDRTFAVGRQDAERRARQDAFEATGDVECTLEEIWAAMPTAAFVDGAADPAGVRASGIDAELAVEADLLGVHPGAAALLTAARAHDIDVVLVSDTYFSVDQLGRLLTTAGVDLEGIEVVTSSSRRCNKWSGLLEDVIAEHGGPEGALHVGDNPVSDVVVGHRAGVTVCQVDLPVEHDSIEASNEPWERLSSAIGSDGGRSAAMRETLVRAGPRAADPAYQFGAGIAGPLMAGFAGWVSSTAEELGAGALHCLLREGRRIAELIDVVRPDGPPRRLVHASRWGIMRAAVIDGTPEQLERALARRQALTADHVAAAFGCDVERVATTIGARTVAREHQVEAFRAIADDDELRDRIVDESARMRANVVAYLSRTLQLDDGPLVLCDIGWGGTIQIGLTDILRSTGIEQDVIGLYALLSPTGEMRAARGDRMLGYLPTVGSSGTSFDDAQIAIRHPEFLERINTPAEGTLLGFDDDGAPVTRPDDHDEIGASLASAQAGVLDYCESFALMLGDDERRRSEWFSEDRFAATSLASLASAIAHPDPRLAASLGTWQHDDVAGTAAEPLAGTGFSRWVPYANAVDAASITMHDVFWVPGAAGAANAALASQHRAIADGANPDALCPPSPTGTARIAVFSPDSQMAAAQLETTPRTGPAGWMLLQLDAPVGGARSVRVDIGESGLAVEFADAQIVFETTGGSTVTVVDRPADLRDAGYWVGGRWLGEHHAVVQAGGHLLVDVPDELAGSIASVAVSIAARSWLLDDAALTTLLPRWRTTGDMLARRVRARLPIPDRS